MLQGARLCLIDVAHLLTEPQDLNRVAAGAGLPQHPVFPACGTGARGSKHVNARTCVAGLWPSPSSSTPLDVEPAGVGRGRHPALAAETRATLPRPRETGLTAAPPRVRRSRLPARAPSRRQPLWQRPGSRERNCNCSCSCSCRVRASGLTEHGSALDFVFRKGVHGWRSACACTRWQTQAAQALSELIPCHKKVSISIMT